MVGKRGVMDVEAAEKIRCQTTTTERTNL